jgi:ABC-type sugar transport system substrate-binding protein
LAAAAAAAAATAAAAAAAAAAASAAADGAVCAGLLPVNHPNLTVLIANPAAHPLPSGHPEIDPWIGVSARPAYSPYRVSIPFWHPTVEAAYRGGRAAPAYHPDVHRNLTGAHARARALHGGG